ncbi:MAG: methionyl-tRNA formyltransferase [Deltaproteobacteria bacterium]|nr:methionyl-tRNA formyltransferase [Deltaproteobacteria bacterium]
MVKIGLFLSYKWGKTTFERLVEDQNIEIKFVCLRGDEDTEEFQSDLKRQQIPFYKYKNINTYEFIKKIKNHGCDIFVSFGFNQIFKKEVLQINPSRFINCHPGKLPFYRGRNVLNWCLINDEKELGITVHFIDEGIDTGDIILQHMFPITDDDEYETLLNKTYEKSPELILEAIAMICCHKDMTVIKQNDIHPLGFYCGAREKGDEIIDWNQTSREVFNFIRAISKPGPMAQSFINGKEIRINKTKIIPNAPTYKGIPGQIIGVTLNGFAVKTKDSTLEIVDYEFNGKVKTGDRLKSF